MNMNVAKTPAIDPCKKRQSKKKRSGAAPDRRVQRDAGKRKSFPKRPKTDTHPFETTLDF